VTEEEDMLLLMETPVLVCGTHGVGQLFAIMAYILATGPRKWLLECPQEEVQVARTDGVVGSSQLRPNADLKDLLTACDALGMGMIFFQPVTLFIKLLLRLSEAFSISAVKI
jgi:hypothetical protein